jgi:very-long-chain (3R)-3-hydroxyacyl-CoA dehydratase
MLLAWSITEVVRYSFYAFQLLFGEAPFISLWTRYTFFYLLYPVGAGSEFMCVWNALPYSAGITYMVLITACCVYPPGFYVMYTHMIKQRRKALKPKVE